MIAALYEVSLQRHGNFDVDICLDIFLWNQLNLSVVLRNPTQVIIVKLIRWVIELFNLLIVGEKIEQIKAKNGIFALRFANDAIELIIVALQHADVSLKLLDILLFD